MFDENNQKICGNAYKTEKADIQYYERKKVKAKHGYLIKRKNYEDEGITIKGF